MRTIVVAGALVLAILGAGLTGAAEEQRTSEQRSGLDFRRAVSVELGRLHRIVDRQRAVLRHRPSVQEALDLAAVTFGVSRDELGRIAFCESRFQPEATNGQYIGLMQFGPLWYSTPYAALPRTSPYAAALAAAWVRREQGSWRAWSCWR